MHKFIENIQKKIILSLILMGRLEKIKATYQPKVHLKTNKIVGAEALMRYENIKNRLLTTKDFIDFAESYNYIHKIDYKIAEEVMKTLRFYIDNGYIENDFRISFNVSIKTFSRKDFIPKIKKIMEKYNILGKFLEIEITETILTSSYYILSEKLNEVMELGIEVSLDDFTAGHSFSTIINQVPMNSVKFDKEILKKVTEEPSKSNCIYETLIILARNLNLKIVAEGVETPLQLEFLRKNNIDIVQGYLINPPLFQEEFANKYFYS